MGGSDDNEIKETEQQKAAAEVARQQWDIYDTELKGFEDTFIQRVDNFNSDSNMVNVKQDTDLSYQNSFSDTRNKTSDSLTASGIDPSSAKYQDTMNDITSEQVVQQNDTINRAQTAEGDKHVAGLKDVAALGAGQKAEALSGMGDVALTSARKAAFDAEHSFNRHAANKQFAGAMAGAGVSAGLRSTTQAPTLNMASTDGVSTVKPVNTYDHINNPDGMMYS